MTQPFIPLDIPLEKLFLDPNNYRFIDKGDYKQVSEEKALDARIQQRTLTMISGKKNEQINDLIQSLTSNGYLPVDQIQVKAIQDGNYLVLEGNRRVSALKRLQERYSEGKDIGALEPEIFQAVPVVSYEADQGQLQQIVMGLKHIEVKQQWSAISKAQFLWNLTYNNKSSEEHVTASLGITKRKLRQSLRTLALIKEYKASDFGDQFETDMYTIFEEIIRTGSLQKWIGWDNSKMESLNIMNRDRLFSWISKDERVLTDEMAESDAEPETVKLERIITKYTDIRDLATFIDDEKALQLMEESRSLTQAYAVSDKVKENLLQQSIDNVEKQLSTAAAHLRFAKTEDRNRLKNILAALTHLVPEQGMPEILTTQSVPRQVYAQNVKMHFSSLYVENYKKLKGVSLSAISKINIIAGINNAGKSTLLEAIFLLARQNDIYGFFDLYRRRGKFQTLNQLWLHQQEIQDLRVSGHFEDIEVAVQINKSEEEDETLDKSSYLSTLTLHSQIAGQANESRARLYKNRDLEVYFKNILLLCNSVYSSPFSQNDKQDIIDHHEKSVESKHFDKIMDFLREKVDGDIHDIELAGELKRFLVTHSLFNRAVDLTQFGEGMQRMFHVALQFASSVNGVLLIDELENAIHYTLLRDFTVLIQRLAATFNVQVFVTTHSKECVDAFLQNGLPNQDISGYRLVKEDANVVCQHISGKDLALLSESINLDLRGGA